VQKTAKVYTAASSNPGWDAMRCEEKCMATSTVWATEARAGDLEAAGLHQFSSAAAAAVLYTDILHGTAPLYLRVDNTVNFVLCELWVRDEGFAPKHHRAHVCMYVPAMMSSCVVCGAQSCL
jgi:hypothetical protein